jgi:Reverse transcriptase (RNA-dependent DNA polymerase)
MPRIMSSVILSLSLFSSKMLSLELSITSQLSRLSPSFVFPYPPLAGSTLYSIPPVTLSAVFKLLNTSPLKSSSLDFLPASLLKSCPAVFSDLIAHLANLSFSQSHFPTLFKSASVTPLLKKPGLDKSLPSNYRPISNLSTISKVLERLFFNRVQSAIVSSPNFNQFQNAYRPRHCTETCPLATLDNIFSSSDSRNSTLLVSLDLIFDSIDHFILLSRLKTSFGFDGLVYNWIESYLTGRSQIITIGNNSSASIQVASCVPQDSVLGLLLFSIHTSPIASIASTLSVPQQHFADDSQLYISLLHLTSPIKSIALKNVSLPYTPGAAITHYLLILTSPSLFSSELGNALILSRMSPRSTWQARLFQWRIMSSYSASHSTTTCRWTSM